MKNLLADSAYESLFWLVMAIVWVVVQVIARATKQQMRKRGAPSPTPAATVSGR